MDLAAVVVARMLLHAVAKHQEWGFIATAGFRQIALLLLKKLAISV
jgi:hypothetical protein